MEGIKDVPVTPTPVKDNEPPGYEKSGIKATGVN
jgi:hypothetical protein